MTDAQAGDAKYLHREFDHLVIRRGILYRSVEAKKDFNWSFRVNGVRMLCVEPIMRLAILVVAEAWSYNAIVFTDSTYQQIWTNGYPIVSDVF